MNQLTLSLKFSSSPARQAIERSSLSEEEIIAAGISILEKRLKRGSILAAPQAVKSYVTLTLGCREHEVFYCLYLNNQLEHLETQELFRGTLTQAAVYPREVVKEALKRNAAAVVIAHNHPSGSTEPSRADIQLTQKLAAALETVDIRLIDHIIVGGGQALSLRESGQM